MNSGRITSGTGAISDPAERRDDRDALCHDESVRSRLRHAGDLQPFASMRNREHDDVARPLADAAASERRHEYDRSPRGIRLADADDSVDPLRSARDQLSMAPSWIHIAT